MMSMIWNPRFQAVDDAKFPHSGHYRVLPRFPYGKGTGLRAGVPRVYGWGLGVNKFSPYKKAATEFVKFIASEETQLELAKRFNNSPTVVSVFENADYLKAVPVASEMQQALRPGIPRPVSIKWNEIIDAVGLHVQKAVVGEQTAEEALADIEKKMNALLAE